MNTPVLLSSRGILPRKVIGTVDTSEFIVTLSATAGFLLFLGWEELSWLLVLAFVIGGVMAAPLAAWLVKKLPPVVLGVAAGGFIILTNSRTLLTYAPWNEQTLYIIYSLLITGYAAAVVFSIRTYIKLHRHPHTETRLKKAQF